MAAAAAAVVVAPAGDTRVLTPVMLKRKETSNREGIYIGPCLLCIKLQVLLCMYQV